MTRLLLGLALGIYLGFNAPKIVRTCREIGECCFRSWHDEAHRMEIE